MNFDDYITTKEASEVLDIDIRSVSRLLREEKIEGVKVGRDWFILKTSFEAYLKAIEGLNKHDPRRGKKGE